MYGPAWVDPIANTKYIKTVKNMVQKILQLDFRIFDFYAVDCNKLKK